MIAKPSRIKVVTLVFAVMILNVISAQNDSIQETTSWNKFIDFYDLRGTNTIATGAGTAVINGDFQDPLFEIYFKGGYKRSISPHFGISISYHKFNLAYEDMFNFGYMSFDLNLEYLVLPHKRVSPFIFGGAGYNASNYFEETATKAQAGGGIECVVTEGLAISLFTDYNYVFDDTLDGLEAGGSDDTYFRIGFGLNFYFGGAKKKAKLMGGKTVINSNLIYPKKDRVTK